MTRSEVPSRLMRCSRYGMVSARGVLVGSLLVLWLVIASCAHNPLPSRQSVKIAVLPFANFTEVQEAPEQIMPLVVQTLEAKGFAVVSGEPVEDVLFRHRVRRTTLVTAKTAQALASELGVNAVMVGLISMYQPDEVPQVGISARLVKLSSAEVIWAQDVSLAGTDFTGMLGLGTVRSLETLAARGVNRLFASLQPRLEPQAVTPPEPPGALSFMARPEYPTLYRDPSADFFGVDSLAVLPFLNASDRPNAGEIVTALFVSSLFNTGRYRVIEPGLVWEVFLRFRILSIGSIDRLELPHLNRHMVVQGYVLGTVYEYVEGKGTEVIPPKVAISARMVRADDARVVWSMEHRHKGDDFNLLLDFDRIYSIIPLARLTVAEMVDTFTGS